MATQFERVAGVGLDPAWQWVDPVGQVHRYGTDYEALNAANGHSGPWYRGGFETIGVRLKAGSERWHLWRQIDRAFDPKEELFIQADGNIVPRDQGLNPFLLGALVLAAPLAVVALPALAGAIGGSATAGVVATASGAAKAVVASDKREDAIAVATAQQSAAQVAARTAAANTGPLGSLAGALNDKTVQLAVFGLAAILAIKAAK